jgi:dolichol kinase
MNTEILWFLALGAWSALTVMAIKPFHAYMMSKGCEHMVAVYYNRKVAHMVAGGVPLIMCPIVFSDPIWPLIGGLMGAIALASTHLLDRRLWWMQTEKNMNDATFALMLGLSVYVLWEYLDDPWLAILPSLFMAYGDGVTGIIRNKLFAKRTKSAWGNLGMAILCIPLGWVIGANAEPSIPMWGAISGAVASFVERYEFGPIDDNVLIVIASSAIIALGVHFGPLL